MAESSESTKTSCDDQKYPVVNIRGLLFPEFFIDADTVERVIDYKPAKDDTFIVTYPKCGTTWTQFLVWEVLHKGAVPPSPNQMMFHYIPFLEFTGIDVIENLPKPKVMKTHLPFNLQPYSKSAKYIYIVRNPWDCCVSYYHHHCLEPGMPQLTFDQYFKLFIKGELGWGDFFDHVLSWYPHRNDPNILFLTYEDMKKNTRKVLLQIAEFLGESYYNDLQDEEVMNNCLKHSDFKYLKQMGMFFPKNPKVDDENAKVALKEIGEIDRNNAKENFTEVPFFRKGVIGDWRNYFSGEQIKIFNAYLINKLKNTEMENFWKPVDEETSL
ncbi:sulfotransferase 1C2 [Trichonephila clavata]|uniref:Sulfotransferase 1C2 n=1 Tax=Trichonephila clavata TaxID=2740835 RepID=A0A8X6HTL6_TRICU|nr:sulfotransferase 1C2 [Trichonephila clavata]